MDETTRIAKIMQVRDLVKERDEARKAGNFIKADRLRDTLTSTHGVEVIDQINGPSGWKFKDGTSKKLPPGTVPNYASMVTADKQKKTVTTAGAATTGETNKKRKRNDDDVEEIFSAKSKSSAATSATNESKSTPAAKKAKPSAETERNKALATQLLSGAAPVTSSKPKDGAKPAAAAPKPAGRNVNGVLIQDLQLGRGAKAQTGSKIKVNYVGRLASNNKIFDSSTNPKKAFAFHLGRGEVISGWEIGCVGMMVGGTRRLTIPPEKAYGRQGAPPTIPSNATLIFDVTLVEVK